MPLDHDIYRSKMVVLTLRVTQQQDAKLKTLRDTDGMSVQEHVRRALDIYLARVTPRADQKEAARAS